MNIFISIFNFFRSLFIKRIPTGEEIINDAKKVLEVAIDQEVLIGQIRESEKPEEKEDLVNKLVNQMVAKEIIKYAGKQTENSVAIKRGRKKIYEYHELKAEFQRLQKQKTLLFLAESRIQPTHYPDMSSFDVKIYKLFSLLNKNKIDDKVDLSDFNVLAFDKDFKQLERLLSEKSALRRHKTREQEKRRQSKIDVSIIKKELDNLDSLISQNKVDEAKQLVNRHTNSIKPHNKKSIERLTRAIAKLKETELNILNKRQAELLTQQEEEAQRIGIEQEKKIEQQRIAREQAEAIKKIEEEKNAEKENKLNTLLTKKFNWRNFQKILHENGIAGFYHFTDRSNLKSIKKNGGLFSWYYCDLNRIEISMPGGNLGSRQNDTINGKKDFVRVAFNKEHPMLFIAQSDGRISQPVWLDIDIEVAYFEHTEFSDKNAAAFSSYAPVIGKEIQHLSNIRFDILMKAERVKHYNLLDNEKPYNQAEVLVKTWIPIEYIKNIESLTK